MSKKNPNLSEEQKLVMFEDGTEQAGTSLLNSEKREGSYHCANCGIKLFDSKTKYESGSGWPSFFDSQPEVFETKTDYLLGYARTEYHCKIVMCIMVIFLMWSTTQVRYCVFVFV